MTACDAKYDEWRTLLKQLVSNETLRALSLRGLDAEALHLCASLLGRMRGLRALSLTVALRDGEDARDTDAGDARALQQLAGALPSVQPGTLAVLRLQVVGAALVQPSSIVHKALDALRKAAAAAACHVELDMQ